MSELENDDILGIIANELANSSITLNSITDLSTPLEYYLGLPNGTEVEGRSSIMSTDVADAIEWIMPQIMKSFTQNNEIVIFDPVHEGDERQAELESEYVYEVLMKQNNGFINVHTLVKDCLLQRNGILKVYPKEVVKVKTEEYSGLTVDQLNLLVQQDGVELLSVAGTEYIDSLTGESQQQFEAKFSYTKKSKKICIDPVPLEEFRVNAGHNSISLENARFTAHVTTKTVSDLVEEGYDSEILEQLPLETNFTNQYRFNLQGEATNLDFTTADDSMRLITVSECYMRMDINDDDIAELVKITVAGSAENPSVVLSIEEIDSMPWVSAAAILMSHKFQGLSIYDRLKEIQDNKTALIRNVMDNIYFSNNQRLGVIEAQVNLDDLMTNRPGGIVRMKRPDAVFPLVTPQLGDAPMSMMRYLDEIRSGRSGVTPEGNATPQKIGENVGSQGVERLMTASEELVGLIVRVVAETGIKPLCIKIRDLCTKHLDTIHDFQFRSQWVKVNPATWCERTNCTVRVGTGTGDHAAKIQALSQVLTIQEKVLANPSQALVNEEVVFNALDDLCKFGGLNGANRYFVDPKSNVGQQARQIADQNAKANADKNNQLESAMAEAQLKVAQAETDKVRVMFENTQLKAKNDSLRQEFDAKVAELKNELDQANLIAKSAKDSAEMNYKNQKMIVDAAIRLTEIEVNGQKDQNANFEQNYGDINGQN